MYLPRQRYSDIVVDSLNYCIKEKNLHVFAYVIMSNHIHTIMRAGNENLSDVIRDFKRHTSVKIMESIKEEPESRRQWMMKLFSYAAKKHIRNKQQQFWTHENHSVNLYSPKFIKEKLSYIHNNPVRAGLVSKPEDYLYSSARDYMDEKGMVEVIVISHAMLGIDN